MKMLTFGQGVWFVTRDAIYEARAVDLEDMPEAIRDSASKLRLLEGVRNAPTRAELDAEVDAHFERMAGA